MASSNFVTLPNPVSKSKKSSKCVYPFPIIRSNCNETQADPNWQCMIGYLQDYCILVHDDESIKILYSQGFFGKGTLSKNAPKVCVEDKEIKNEKSERVLQNEASNQDDDIIDVDDDEEDVKPSTSKEENIEVVISDSDSSSEIEVDSVKKKDSSKEDQSDEKESLQLTFEEAYFLSYALGCLVIKDNKDQPIDLARLWNKFCESSPDGNFPVMYTAYHHFRSKGWIVKQGLKYGVDYLLYKDGPAFYHATYSVIVKPVKEQNFREVRGSRQMTWSSLLALNRLNSSTGKSLLFLYVIKPSGLSENKISTPFCISQYKVEEVLFQRWVASENRGEND
ncbi:tRNA-splicing endonuclease subunit Sen2 [Parasteatoda tepidariorum]|uniref:tRNA-splicing endonuclease subunit Sen2 n=1 Tax=Parasteatoda tepidariorum TaxID=114398 RepID=UPI001C724245|nr:tRNA-splicing endonuclease subunit Sen2 [Parasteatoda tepidariorum]